MFPSISVEDPTKLVDLAQIIGGFAALFTFLVAIIAGFITMRQIKAQQKIQREATAKDIYKQYLQLAFENPKYAYVRDYSEFSGIKLEQYQWFISNLLWGCEEIINYAEGNEWEETIKSQLTYHISYLKSNIFRDGEYKHYSFEIKNLIDQVCK